MSPVRQLGTAGMLLTASVCSMAAAQEVEGPHAVVTALTGGGATRGPGGPAFPVTDWDDYANDYVLRPGETIVTADDGTAVLMLPGYETVIHVGDGNGRCESTLNRVPGLQGGVPVGLNVQRGQALVVRKPDDRRWLLVACRGAGTRGYVLSRGASFVARSGDDELSFSVSHGEVVYFAGRPARRFTDQAGELTDRAGVVVPAGQRLSARAPQQPAPDDASVPRAISQMNEGLYAFALTKGIQWVEQAEQGDLVPARGAVRGVPRALAEQVGGGRATFDQPRSVSVVTTPRVAAAPSGAGFRATPLVENVGVSLIRSGVPTSVVVGQRFLRTRIIGNPGTSGGVRANPQAQQLIRLPGRQ
ncbi:MAG: hypothetical protein ACYSVY_04355 [Planctomycetota bacterium]